MSPGGKGGNMLNNEESINKHRIGSKKGTDKANLLRKGKTYEEIYGDKSDEEKEKRKLAVYKNINLYELITPQNEIIIFDGRLEFKNYLKSINVNFEKGFKLNIDKFMVNEELFGFKLNIINKKQLNDKL